MDPEHGRDDYEGFFSAEKRDAARVQRLLMFQWRLLCSGQDSELARQYGRGLGLSFEESQRLDDDLRINKDVLTWGQLRERCGRHLSYFVSTKPRAPTIETLLDMSNAGGEVAVTALLQQRKQLTTTELRDLRKSPEHLARLRCLAPELLPEEESPKTTPTAISEILEESPPEAAIVQLPLGEMDHVARDLRGYFDWEDFLREGGPLGFEVDTLAPECLDIFSRSWRDDCTHEAQPLDYSRPPYLRLLAGHVPGHEADHLARDLRLSPERADQLRESLRSWDQHQWGAAVVQLRSGGVSSRIVDNLFPDGHNAENIEAGYRLLRGLFFPQHLQDGWPGPMKKTGLGRTLICQYYGPNGPREPSTALKVHVTSLHPPTVYLHTWPNLSPHELLWGRIARDLWGGVLGYCKAGRHWFFTRPYEKDCGQNGHWNAQLFASERDAQHVPRTAKFPPDLLYEVINLPEGRWELRDALDHLIKSMGPIDERCSDPPLARRISDIDTLHSFNKPLGMDHQCQVMKELISGVNPDGDSKDEGFGFLRLLNNWEPHLPDANPPWPHVIAYGSAFPAVRLFSNWTDDRQPVRYAPASIPQLLMEAAAASAVECSVDATQVVLWWGPFWCARPGCPNLFVTPKLQQDLRACTTPSGFRSLMLSQYCSHSCFIADKLDAKPTRSRASLLRGLTDVRTLVKREPVVRAGESEPFSTPLRGVTRSEQS